MQSQSTDCEWLRSAHPEDLQPTVRAIADSRRRGTQIDVRYRVWDGIGDGIGDGDGDGVWRWKRSRGSPRFDATGNIVCWYGSVEDSDAPSQSPEVSSRSGTAAAKLMPPRGMAKALPEAKEEERRLQALHELEILDTPAEVEFDDLVALASEICSTPISLLSLVDAERQWFKAAVGMSVSETDLQSSFCVHVIRQRGLLVVKDATEDKRFKRNPLVLGDPHIRFYAGMPLYAGDGLAVGTLCVIDTSPRSLLPGQLKAFTILSHQVQKLLELRYERLKYARELGPLRTPAPSRVGLEDRLLKDLGCRMELRSAETASFTA